jgi:hypothetical protein
VAFLAPCKTRRRAAQNEREDKQDSFQTPSAGAPGCLA